VGLTSVAHVVKETLGAMTTFLDCVVAVATLLLVVYGLTLVLGVLQVINLAHAGFMAIGVYIAYALPHDGWDFVLAVAGATVGTAIVGYAVELIVVQRLYRRPVDTILATWGISLMIVQVITLIAGAQNRGLAVPLNNSWHLLGTSYSAYQLVLVLVAAAILIGLALLIRFSEVGRTIRMVMSNQQMAQGLGINTTRVRRATFTVGAAFAGLAGGLLGPLQGVSPQFATTLLIPAFLAVLVAGTTIPGLFVGCAVLAVIETLFATYVNPAYSVAVLVLTAVVVLRFAPRGIRFSR
jgi:urea transport system permease protein